MNSIIKYFLPGIFAVASSYAFFILKTKSTNTDHALYATAVASVSSIIFIILQIYLQATGSTRGFSR